MPLFLLSFVLSLIDAFSYLDKCFKSCGFEHSHHPYIGDLVFDPFFKSNIILGSIALVVLSQLCAELTKFYSVRDNGSLLL